MFRITVTCLTTAVLVFTPLANAHGPDKHTEHAKQDNAAQHDNQAEQSERVGDAYPLLTDSVTNEPLADVKEPVSVVYQGRDLHFANEANAKTFADHPAKYLAQVDQKIIAQQKEAYPLTTCVVSGDKFGGDMGEPIDKVYGNRLIRFCCPGCQADFNKDPAKYLAKIDAAIIEANQKTPQTVCPVTGGKLGDMGKPVDYVFANRLIRFCCPACIKSFEANPAKYLSKMDHAPKAAQEHDKKNDGHAGHKH